MKELFHYIVRYTPQTIELETRFKPFIPDYVPAVGDIDAFIKVRRPDGKQVRFQKYLNIQLESEYRTLKYLKQLKTRHLKTENK